MHKICKNSQGQRILGLDIASWLFEYDADFFAFQTLSGSQLISSGVDS